MPAAPTGAQAPPRLRLPGDVRPARQSVELVVDPAAEAYSGSVEIELDVLRPTTLVWLNATRLKITKAQLGSGDGVGPARLVAGGDDFVGVAREREPLLRPGPARLRLAFEGRLSRVESEGLFVVRERGEFYLFSQFEPVAARKAFPCFDEPGYKIPWTVTLRVPAGLVALSNSPVAATGKSGTSIVTSFAPTAPLPSYLVALAVGPFDVVDTGPAGRARTPTRIVVPRGRAAETSWARQSTPRVLELLESYFGRPYPYAKLDQIAVPGVSFAMEHPGLVTYGADLLVQGDGAAVLSRRAWVSVCAHELAHQWFGDLVTMAWWDDTWLNEAFAGWLGEKVRDLFDPAWGVALERVASRSLALDADALPSARRVRQPIASKDDIAAAFDAITYAKGEAVLEMVEAWLGPEAFRRGVQAYVAAHAGGTASADDFVAALSAASGKDTAPVLRGFLDQPGAPLLHAELSCTESPRLVLRQQPYRPLGALELADRKWSVPACVKVPGATAPVCRLLAAGSSELPLATRSCPEWVFANAGATGYYRLAVPPALARRALELGALAAEERIALAGDLGALVASGELPAAEALRLVPLLAADPSRHVVTAAVGLVRRLEPMVPEDGLPAFAALVRRAFGRRAAALGWSARAAESEDEHLLRRELVPAVAELGRDPELGRQAVRLVTDWLDGRALPDADAIDPLLAAAASAGGRPLFDRLRDALVRASDRAARERLIGALGGVREPALVREAMALTLDDRIDARESASILVALGSRRETRRAAWDFVREHYDALAARLPEGPFSPLAALPWIGASLCTNDAAREVESFFGTRFAGSRARLQARESVEQCAAQRAAQAAGLSAFLSDVPP